MKRQSASHQKGQATTLALVAIGATTIAVLLMADKIVNVERDLRYPRIKAQQTIQKVRLTTALNLPLMYTGCDAVSDKQIQTCILDVSSIQSVLTSVKGADCSDGYTKIDDTEILPLDTGCGLPTCGCGFSIRPVPPSISNPTPGPIWDKQARKFNAVLHYMGKDASIADTLIEFNVPGQLLTGDITICPTNKPQFQGFDANGSAICVAFQTSTCPAGQFVDSVDPVTFAVTCNDYTSSPSCGSKDNMFSSLNFSNGKYSAGCIPRLNPFLYYDYNPENSVTSQAFRGPTIDQFHPGDYSYYDVFFDSPIIAEPPTRACNADTGPW